MKASKSKRSPRSSRVARPSTRRGSSEASGANLGAVEVREIESLRQELDRLAAAPPPRWNANPEDVRRSVGKLVLTLVEFIRQLLERQAIRRMDAGTLTAEETEAVGLALMRLEETVRDVGSPVWSRPRGSQSRSRPIGKLM